MFSRSIFSPRAARAWRWLLPLCGIAVGASGAENSSLLAAVKDGDAASLRSLLAERADPNEADADGTSVLHWAVHQGEIESVATLLAAGRSRRRTAIATACVLRIWPPRTATRR